jgi:hypothetical protein
LPKEKHKYHIEKYQKVGFIGKDNIFIYDKEELKSFVANKLEREKVIKKFVWYYLKSLKTSKLYLAGVLVYFLLNNEPKYLRPRQNYV